MNIEVKIGDALNEGQEVKITEIHRKIGDKVEVGDILFDYETDKTVLEFTSNITGIIEDISVSADEFVNADTVVAIIKSAEMSETAQPEAEGSSSEAVSVSLGDNLSEDQSVVVGNVYFKAGDSIRAGDVILEYETDKASVEFTSPETGTVERIYVTSGDTINGQTLLLTTVAENASSRDSAQDQQDGVAETNHSESSQPREQTELMADITIIGGGPGGYVAAIKAAQMGKKVVVVEKEKLGGTCLNWGCIPTKTLVRSAEVYDLMQSSEEFGCLADNVRFDMNKVMARKNSVVKQLVDGIDFLFSKNDITTVNGNATMVNAETVVVENGSTNVMVRSDYIIIATGSISANLPFLGADLEDVIDSKAALSLSELPDKMVIVGGGVIGMEFAFIFASFGVDVSVVEYADSVLISCDKDVRNEIEKVAVAKGIKLYTRARVEEIIKTEPEGCVVAFDQQGEKHFITSDKVLMAVGRNPFFDGIGIEEAGVELNDNGRGIKVNSKMQTNVSNIYAIGDVTNIIQLAHVASHQGIVAVNNISGIESEMDYHAVPSAIFTHPEIGMVGLTEELARESGREINVGQFPFLANGKALALGENKGFIKIIADKVTGKVLGASIVGANATDMIAELTLAVRNGLTTEQIIETIHAHPTTAEIVHEAALSFHGGSIHF
ncbi:dihydrolipoyl dehydrogenase [Vibrio alginolyticus]|nr:dihydrolipoyl dehydrogenase [Vibrio parahaemolyticus]ELA7389037.1 dihydrolipoyl dehydrogenase [Vibrio alginolyticus]WMN90557.1 dihydrolipoyl dehydrogenase [Vibrio parahaemolyticus]WMO08217.1 dihydrolipoyl dehydrogenase [Vibrio parahaemolyticus]